MAFNVVKEASGRQGQDKVLVVLEGDSYEELTSHRVKDAALAFANDLGLGSCAISKMDGPYGINRKGEALDNDKAIKAYEIEQKLYGVKLRFRHELTLQRSMV